MRDNQSDAERGSAAAGKNLVKRYPGVLALDDVSISIAPGEVRAVLGKNGAGKSTLIRLLTGAETPNAGEIFIKDRPLTASPEKRTRVAAEMGVRAVYQELSLIPEMTVAENFFLGKWPNSRFGIDSGQMIERARAIIDDLRFPIDPRETVSRLPIAKRQLVEIARAMADAPALAILDEPTSSLSSEEVELLFNAIRGVAAKGVAVLYVSHRMKEIRAIADSATVMRDGRIIETFDVANTSTEDAVELMLGKVANKIHPVEATPRPGDPILSVEGLTIPGKVSDISFELRVGEVLGIAGLLGTGRTEILRAIAGLDEVAEGTIRYRERPIDRLNYRERINAGIAITPENRKDDGIFPELSVSENIVLGDLSKVTRHGVVDGEKVRRAAHVTIEKMSVKTASQSSPMTTLSGGNQQKIVIGRWLYAGADVLLLDEPTRGVDVEAKAQIYDIVRSLVAEGKAVIFVSSEIEELPLVCDRVVVLKEGRLAGSFTAPYVNTDALLSATID